VEPVARSPTSIQRASEAKKQTEKRGRFVSQSRSADDATYTPTQAVRVAIRVEQVSPNSHRSQRLSRREQY
jgi:hypothetical protein